MKKTLKILLNLYTFASRQSSQLMKVLILLIYYTKQKIYIPINCIPTALLIGSRYQIVMVNIIFNIMTLNYQ